jgi:hypothetical protein
MSMYVVVLSDIELGSIESLRVGTTLSGALMGAPSIPATLTLTPLRIVGLMLRIYTPQSS